MENYFRVFLNFWKTLLKLPRFSKWPPKRAGKDLQRTSKYGHLRKSLDICHVRMTDIDGFLTIYGQSDNLLNNIFFLLSVDVSCDVINGAFEVYSNAGNGHRGQEGTQGATARDSGHIVRSCLLHIHEAIFQVKNHTSPG